jgi:putative ABC transport system ATP-binding protein
VIRVSRVRKVVRPGSRSSVVALCDVSLAVPRGTAIGVTGPDGSGKSTLLHLLGALDRPDSGTIHVGDQDLRALSRRGRSAYRRTLGFVMQHDHLEPSLTVLDNILATAPPARSAEREAHARRLLDDVGLGDRAALSPARLSPGQRQLTAVARALIDDPSLLLADEPAGGLDPGNRTALTELLLRLCRARGTTAVVATRDPLLAARCDQLLVLDGGRVV